MVEDVKLDFARAQRIGIGEAIFCAGKSAAQISNILDLAAAADAQLLLTRLTAEKFGVLGQRGGRDLDYDPLSQTAFFNHRAPASQGAQQVAIVAAGTSDSVVAREALRTLEFNGISTTAILDVGVAGLWRLMERLEDIRAHRVVIVVAGMDAALVSVLGGLIGQPLIAVPTSAGYGAARHGETALAAALATCAPGVTVCNIDNGYGAACAALRIVGDWCVGPQSSSFGGD